MKIRLGHLSASTAALSAALLVGVTPAAAELPNGTYDSTLGVVIFVCPTTKDCVGEYDNGQGKIFLEHEGKDHDGGDWFVGHWVHQPDFDLTACDSPSPVSPMEGPTDYWGTLTMQLHQLANSWEGFKGDCGQGESDSFDGERP